MRTNSVMSHEESETQGTGSAKELSYSGASERPGTGGIGGTSVPTGNISFGAAGEARTERSTRDPITGGILSQLIKQIEGQLAESRECVDWYERKTKEYQDQLDELKHLQSLMESEFTE